MYAYTIVFARRVHQCIMYTGAAAVNIYIIFPLAEKIAFVQLTRRAETLVI